MATLSEVQSSVALQIKLSKPIAKLSPEVLLNFAVTGLNEEAGEVSGLLCREIYKNIDISSDWWIEELGDVLWYLAAAASVKGFTLDQIWEYNIAKLKERYGEFREHG